MKRLFKISIIASFLIFLGACESTELEGLLNNPNAVTPENAELDLVFNRVMLDFKSFVYEAHAQTAPYTRMLAMTGGYQYNSQDQPQSFDYIWELAYANLLPDIELVISSATEKGSTVHAGIAKILKAYVYMTLVDLFGDIPYSEALGGASNPSPKADDDKAVYEAAAAVLAQGIDNLKTPVGSPVNDLYYNKNVARWIKLGKTLQLRYHVMTRLSGGSATVVNALLAEGDLINSADEDFQFKYSNNRSNPDSRHPAYSGAYESAAGAYLSNYYMWLFFADKTTEDPRLRYYFYRQDCDEREEDLFTLGCRTQPYPFHWADGYPFCTAGLMFSGANNQYLSYWGRDHGDASGIPPDNQKRTAIGVYPAGGKFDANNCAHVQRLGVDGLKGAGIQPIMMSSWVDFLKAEAALTMSGVAGDPRSLLESGVRKSISKVMAFGAADATSAYVPSTAQIDAYVAEVLADYDAAATTDAKLNVIIKEYHLALWGNGLEAYNNYRRTGKPAGMQPTLQADAGTFPRLLWYPANYANLNANADQRNLAQQVFWDTNAAGFIK